MDWPPLRSPPPITSCVPRPAASVSPRLRVERQAQHANDCGFQQVPLSLVPRKDPQGSCPLHTGTQEASVSVGDWRSPRAGTQILGPRTLRVQSEQAWSVGGNLLGTVPSPGRREPAGHSALTGPEASLLGTGPLQGRKEPAGHIVIEVRREPAGHSSLPRQEGACWAHCHTYVTVPMLGTLLTSAWRKGCCT